MSVRVNSANTDHLQNVLPAHIKSAPHYSSQIMGLLSCDKLLMDYLAKLTVSCRGGGRDQFRRRITAHFGSHQVDLCAAAGVGANLCMLVEVQFPRVHDLPEK